MTAPYQDIIDNSRAVPTVCPSAEEYRLSLSKQPTVVIVDDDSEIRKALESLLWSADFNVMSFASAEDALKSSALAEASCLITDIRMPGMQGRELQLRMKSEHPELPAIMITGHPDEKTRQGALSDGAVAFLCKPLDPGDLLRAVNSAIAKSKHGI